MYDLRFIRHGGPARLPAGKFVSCYLCFGALLPCCGLILLASGADRLFGFFTFGVLRNQLFLLFGALYLFRIIFYNNNASCVAG